MFPLGDAEEMKTRLLQLEQENTKVIASLWIVCQIRQGIRKKLETYKSRYLRNLKRPTVHTIIRNGAFRKRSSKKELLDDGVTILM